MDKMGHQKLKWFLILSEVFVIIGIIFWLLAGCANWLSDHKECLGMTEGHLFFDALLSFLLAIWLLFWSLVYHYFKHEEWKSFANSFLDFLTKLVSSFRKERKQEIQIE